MGTGPTSFYKAWAIASSVACVALVAYIAASHWTAPADDGPGERPPDATGPPDAESGGSAYAVPAALRDLPREWISRPVEAEPRGHAVLLDPGARELVIERCTHRGYFDLGRGEPRPDDWSFCEGVLAGAIESIADEAFVVQPATGASRRVGYEIRGSEGAPRLVLALGEMRLDLVPGSRNDLYHRLDRLPAIREEHEAMLRHAVGSRPDAGGPTPPSR